MKKLSTLDRIVAVCAYGSAVLCAVLCIAALCGCAAVAVFQPMAWQVLMPCVLAIAFLFGAMAVCAFDAGDDHVRGF